MARHRRRQEWHKEVRRGVGVNVKAFFREHGNGGSILMWRLIFSLLLAFAAWGQTTHPILAVGSPAPDFSLPGVDGKIHRLADYAASPVLVVVFTCNHCPIAQMYEQRIQQLETAYGHRGVAIVAIQPNDPKAIRIDELDSSDISDSLDVSTNISIIHIFTTAKRNRSRAPTVRKPLLTSSSSTRIANYVTKAAWITAIARKW